MSDPAETPPAARCADPALGLDACAAQALLQQAPLAIALCDAHGRVEWCNRRLLDLAGAAPARGRGHELAALLGLSPSDAQRLRDAMQRGLAVELPDMQLGTGWWRARCSVLPDGRRATHWQPVDELRQQTAEARRLAELLDLAQDFGRLGVWERDVRTMHGQWDRHMRRFWGLPAGAETPDIDTAVQAVVEEDREGTARSFLESARAAGTYAHRYRVLGADGIVRLLHSQWVVKNGADGMPARMLGILVDDSETWHLARKHAETAEQLQLALQLANIAVFRHDLRSGRVSVSENADRLLGVPPRTMTDLSAEQALAMMHPDDQPAMRDSWERAIASRQPVDVETRFRHADGSWRQVLTRHMLQHDEAGLPLSLLGVGLDITERRAAEAALRQASERAALATRGAGMGTWEQDLLTGEAHWDAQMWRLRGLQPRARALSEQERMALVHPDDRGATLRELTEATAEGRPSYLEFRVRWPDGEWRLIASRSAAVLDERGKPTRRIGVNWDITDVRNAQHAREEKLLAQRESQAKSQFLARMSHELRTPLNAVLGFAQLLLADGERIAADTRRRRLEQIHRAGQHLLSLIDDVLELSSLEGGEMHIGTQPVPLDALVAGTLPLVEQQARQHKVRLRGAALGGTARADATRLRQVLLNLLTNAIKYNREGGQVLVEAEAADGSVVLRVSDTGRGMSEAQLQQAFEPFNRLGLEATGIEGTGIGLAIVKALVERMGGTVHARSTPEAGSVFEVRLPAACADDDAPPSDGAPQAAAAPAAPRAVRPGRLLYIEDNPVNLLIVQELLAQRPDLELDSAVDGLSGVRLAAERRPDLILVDMQLPDIDGHEVLRRLRADPATAEIPCISLSANAMPDDIGRALRAGFADYWTKPLDLQRFMSSLQAIFGTPG